MSVIQLARARIAPFAPRWPRPTRSVEVRVIVGGIEEDAFTASRPGTLVRALGPILKHVGDRAVVELTGIERGRSLFRVVDRREPLASLQDAVEFLYGDR